MAALIVMMTAATILEKIKGTEYALEHFYHSPIFICLWGLAAICGLIYIFGRKMQKSPATMALHLSLVLILAGALTTHLCGKSGYIELAPGQELSSYLDDDGSPAGELPFSIKLNRFVIEHYEGSKAPSDFVSEVSVSRDGKSQEMTISMNNIGKVAGWRLYQADFDMASGSSTLALSHDPWGIGITYCGYLLLLVSMIGFFFQKNSGFKAALRRLGSTAALFLLIIPCTYAAEERSSSETAATLGTLRGRGPSEMGGVSRSETVEEEEPSAAAIVLSEDLAEELGDLYVYYGDRICPLQTLARQYSLKAYGKGHYGPYSAEQVLSGWLFWYDWWKDVPIKLKAKERGTRKEAEKHAIQLEVHNGKALKIFPLADSLGNVSWYSCDDDLPAGLEYEEWVFVRKSLDLLRTEVKEGDWEAAGELISKIRLYQQKRAGSVLPSDARFKAEKFYNGISRPSVPFMATITLGLIFFIIFGIRMAEEKQPSATVRKLLACYAALLLAYLTLAIGLRWYISGHGPFNGSYNIMMLMAWMACIAHLCLSKKMPLTGPLTLLLAGFTMLMASLASTNPKITPLMPVLQSPLLSIHVLSMMLSYTFFGLAALNGIMGLLMPKTASGKLKDISMVILYPAVFLLTFGTFLGAVWANISWGSYWAWDPKETWALITLMVYAMALHGNSLRFMQKPKVFHAYCIFAFLCVLITYFGVNLILGGMHSYA
ncbi:MAG: cytochrome c biogenesis protein CcsA [Bacteroidales bacterium]|nr:cytochrome c biogenesis protein CcsA [Bacteroidales bacterium]